MPISKHEELTSSVDIRLNQNGSYFELTFRGDVTLDCLNSSFIRLIEHPQFIYNVDACYDYRLAHPDLEMSEIEEHAQFVAQYLTKRGRDYKLAMVADDTLNTALLSVYKLLISKTPVEAEVFSSKISAIRWLSLKD